MTLTLADILFVAVVGSVGFYWFNGAGCGYVLSVLLV